MDQQHQAIEFSVTWRGKKFILKMDPKTTLKALGDEMKQLTGVEDDTMRLIMPTNKSSKLIYPFSMEHSCLKLDEASVLEGMSIRMLGVPKGEVDEVLEKAKEDNRIVGFEEEEKRLRQRSSYKASLKLPQGHYIFCGFRTLHLPGIELTPPASEALKLMHTLSADPGIVAVMNKHRWRVGIMTEMAPIGYVGVSPKCLLGLNKNQGEEISLRLRTDDLKGFRKYQSIKKTLLHELAHMVHTEHDANFYALDKQLNEEAAALDWTKSKSHTLSGFQSLENYEDEAVYDSISSPQKLGGKSFSSDPRVSSVTAAIHRFATNRMKSTEESDHMDLEQENEQTKTKLDSSSEEKNECESSRTSPCTQIDEPDPDDPVEMVSSKLRRAVEDLKAQASPSDALRVLQTLVRIIKNVIEHQDEVKFKKLRKANPVIKRDVLNYKGAIDVLILVGFKEETLVDEMGRREDWFVLRRDDPGLLWLAKSSLEACLL